MNIVQTYSHKACNFWRFRLAKKVIIGSAGIPQRGWLATDKNSLNIINRDSFSSYWQPNSMLGFVAEHVWEHLDEDEAKKANANCFEFLKPGGRLRIAVPDGFHPDPNYIESVCPGGKGAGADDHKILYNYRLITEKLSSTGFQVELLEYWDESSKFKFKQWSTKDGYIRRSKLYDPRNQDGSLTYTSLIVDAIKPNI